MHWDDGFGGSSILPHSAIDNLHSPEACYPNMDVTKMRRSYQAGALQRADLADNPFRQFDDWFQTALQTPEVIEANAMTLATADRQGLVSARTVLLKAWDGQGFVFFTNTGSLKARQMAENAHVALLFAWLPLERQISIRGRTEKIALTETLKYFLSRPRASQLGAWVSQQSRPISSRQILESKFEEMAKKFTEGKIPLPNAWSGYRVVPATIEFWQGRRDRLHDRFLYTRNSKDTWDIERLSP